MALNTANLGLIGYAHGLSTYVYNTTDTIDTVLADGYFDAVYSGGSGAVQLRAGDIVFAVCAGVLYPLTVAASASTGVTLAVAGTSEIAVCHEINIGGSATDTFIYTCNQPMQVVDIKAVPVVAGTDGSAVSATITRCQGTEAPASGDDLLGTTKIDLKGSVNTVQDPALTATTANLVLAAGDRLAVDVTGTLTSVVCHVTVTLRKIGV